MQNQLPRSRLARAAAEQTLVRVAHYYGSRPQFVVIGGLVPDLLCAGVGFSHAGTTDVDVQVGVEIACGIAGASRLERALRAAGLEPEHTRTWRWVARDQLTRAVVKFELLADLDTVPAAATIHFDGCDRLGALNLRGTRLATRRADVQRLSARVAGVNRTVEVNVADLAGFLLTKRAAVRWRRKSKDWYDVTFVLLHNSAGGPEMAASAVRDLFGGDLRDEIRSSIDDLAANFATPDAQGSRAYAEQMVLDHADLDRSTLAADAVIAVTSFADRLLSPPRQGGSP